MDEPAIVIERSAEFTVIAHRVSDFLKDLPLTNIQHNTLVELVIEQVVEGEQTAFQQGFRMGVDLGRYLAEHPEEKGGAH